MAEKLTPKWETFRDPAYYDCWAVRLEGDLSFNATFHLVNGDEAKALVEFLNRRSPPPAVEGGWRELDGRGSLWREKMGEMQVYTTVDFTGHYPVGVSAVIVAENEEQARKLIEDELREHGLKFDGTLRRINSTAPRAFVLQNGDY